MLKVASWTSLILIPGLQRGEALILWEYLHVSYAYTGSWRSSLCALPSSSSWQVLQWQCTHTVYFYFHVISFSSFPFFFPWQMVKIQRIPGPKEPAELTYYTLYNGKPLLGTAAAKILSTVDSQRMALTLGYVIQVQADRKNSFKNSLVWSFISSFYLFLIHKNIRVCVRSLHLSHREISAAPFWAAALPVQD